MFYQVARKAVSATFIQFMEHVLAGYPTAPVVVLVLVLDNILIHRSKLVQAWLRAHPRMRLVYVARYSPTTTPSNASGARSRPPWPTARP